MKYASEREVKLHDSLVRHIMKQNIEHETEPKVEQVLGIYNSWSGKYLCDGVCDVTWVLGFIRHVFITNKKLWREALWIDGYIEEGDVYD